MTSQVSGTTEIPSSVVIITLCRGILGFGRLGRVAYRSKSDFKGNLQHLRTFV